MRKVLNGKAVWMVSLLLWVLVVRFLTGCSSDVKEEKKVRDLEFTVIGEAEIPQELFQIIQEKKQLPFKLTYSNDQNLYIVVGYGQQATGGYSMAANEMYLTENSIVIDTELLGPQKGENTGTEASYPYMVVKTEYLENPVVFQ